jgi:hypothetical protein
MNPKQRRLCLNQRQNSFGSSLLTDTPVSMGIIIICAIVYFMQFQPAGLALWPLGSGFFSPWQLVSYAFLHGSFNHLFFNMFAVWMFGTPLERSWGTQRFLSFYAACVVGAAVIQLLVQLLPVVGVRCDVAGQQDFPAVLPGSHLGQMVRADLWRHRIDAWPLQGHAGYRSLRAPGRDDIRRRTALPMGLAARHDVEAVRPLAFFNPAE